VREHIERVVVALADAAGRESEADARDRVRRPQRRAALAARRRLGQRLGARRGVRGHGAEPLPHELGGPLDVDRADDHQEGAVGAVVAVVVVAHPVDR
jgi:hypothetical protein